MRVPAFGVSAPVARPRLHARSRRVLCCLAPPPPAASDTATAGRRLLGAVAAKAGVTPAQVEQLQELGRIVLTANKTTNLTAVRTEEGLIARHLVDGLGLLPLLDGMRVRNIVDLGSGAGFPGLVLAICRPWSLTLVEASRKKSKFQEQAISELGLRNVEALWGRAEDIGHDVLHRESYDLCVARGVAKMPVLAELALPLVRVGGALVAQKSVERGDQRTELQAAANALAQLGGAIDGVEFSWTCDIIRSHLPAEADSEDADRRRAFVTVRKTRATDRVYPRTSGTPKKDPL
jgi:16S rRNA (guanine527-N7)-methyltransferase